MFNRVEHRTLDDDVISLPYYGGAKGQVLQIKKGSDGKVISQIIQQIKDQTSYATEDGIVINAESQHPQSFSSNLQKIQQAAQQLVDLQQSVKKKGQLSKEEQQIYTTNLEKLGISAQNLAHLQNDGSQDLGILLQGPSRIRDEDQNKKKIGEKEEEEEKEEVEEEEDVGEESEGDDDDDDNEGVQVNLPPPDASVAEAKPVGLAIAGVGGVASSKPVATAVVGPGGLAVARPVATAIAGVAPSEVAGIGLPSAGKKSQSPIKYEKLEYLPGRFSFNNRS